MKEHLAKEEHLKEVCLYCGRSMENKHWLSMHHREILYKILHCECGRKAMVRMPFFGSGHDSWNSIVLDEPKHLKTKIRTLESKIKILGGEK